MQIGSSVTPKINQVKQSDEIVPQSRESSIQQPHPWPDHFYHPLHVAIGAAGENAKAKLIHNSIEMGTLSYAFY